MIEFIKQTAREAGLIALADSQHLKSDQIHKKGTVFDLVTDCDRKVEEYITERIRKRYPGAGIYGEETGKTHVDREYCFIIDPIDGTSSFVHGLPNWCVSIGVHRNGKPVAAAVFQPVTNDLYYAEAGKGAFLNGVQIHVSRNRKLADCIVGTGFSCLRAQWKEENNLQFFSRIAPMVTDIRKYGSAALDCCLTARGSLDANWEMILAPYDIAAGELILLEAGGEITDLFGGDSYPDKGILCSNGIIHKEMLSFFHDYRCLQK